jgi:hypothetical protein
MAGQTSPEGLSRIDVGRESKPSQLLYRMNEAMTQVIEMI